jgi:hypothetical protein
MLRLNRPVQKHPHTRSFPALLIIAGIVCGITLSGCASSAHKGAELTRNQGSAQSPTAQRQPVLKEEKTFSELLKLQDLSIREEGGQTTLFVKFSQPINQYRHFPLPQPARIVIDLLSDAERPATTESFRVDTHWVGTLRLTSNETSLRLVADIAAATVPAYVITPVNGGLKIVIGALNASASAKKGHNARQGWNTVRYTRCGENGVACGSGSLEYFVGSGSRQS